MKSVLLGILLAALISAGGWVVSDRLLTQSSQDRFTDHSTVRVD